MVLSRRAFLSSLAVGCLSLSQSDQVYAKPVRVLVLGAGIAGLAAAQTLRQKGYDVVVIEGRNRIGGRIHTSRMWANYPTDMGASWIHGTTNNPITTLANNLKAERVTTSYNSSQLHIAPELMSKGLKSYDETKIGNLISSALKKANQLEIDLSLQQAVNKFVGTSLNPLVKNQIDFYINSRYEQEYSGSANYLSAQTFEDNEVFKGSDVLFPKGYDQITNELAKGLVIKTNQVIREINYTEKDVIVKTQNAQYSANYVVVTLPLGVLKKGNVKFNPPLPAAKQKAIERLGMGLLNKTFLKFDKVFWPKNIDWQEYLSAEKGRWAEWVSFAKIGAPILLGFNAADRAYEVEHWSDQAIVSDAMKVLKSMFGNAIPNPNAYQITRWAQDPFTYGSYSFNAVGSTNQDRNALASSVAGRLFWAGEATSANYQGTVHGAYLSGIKAANAIIKTS